MSIEYRDDSLGFYDASTGIFTTPVDGRYEMQILMNTALNANSWAYQVYLKVDGIIKDQLVRYRSYSMNTYDVDQITTELDLKKNQKVVYYAATIHSALQHYQICEFNGQKSRCSFIQGKLLKRY